MVRAPLPRLSASSPAAEERPGKEFSGFLNRCQRAKRFGTRRLVVFFLHIHLWECNGGGGWVRAASSE
jgi:hypothetical protein